jgi:3-deoxy-D-manno-octulosonic-acid transferase
MARSFSLAAYMAYARRATAKPPVPTVARPTGELIWLHASDAGRAEALVRLAQRLQQQRPGVHFLLTTQDDTSPEIPIDGSMTWQALPEDTVVAAKVFLRHWRPNICVWSGGDLHPALLMIASHAGVPLMQIDVGKDQLAKQGWRLLPDLTKALLGRFNLIMVHNVETALHLRWMGLENVEIHVSGPLHEGAIALPYDSQTREELAQVFLGRPVWLSAMTALDELETVLETHRHVGRYSHRSLLIIVPDDPDETAQFQARLEAQGWRYLLWSEGKYPGDATQVLLADSHDELGLWYVLAPVCFMGNSLSAGEGGHDPNAPAAHGSAIIHGPHVGRYQEQYARYAKAGAARMVHDRPSLTAAVQNLIAPDQSAIMAQAAWDVVSKSAVVTDLVIDLIQDQLDTFEAKP